MANLNSRINALATAVGTDIRQTPKWLGLQLDYHINDVTINYPYECEIQPAHAPLVGLPEDSWYAIKHFAHFAKEYYSAQMAISLTVPNSPIYFRWSTGNADKTWGAWVAISMVGHVHTPAQITQDANNRFVTDVEKAAWNAKTSDSMAIAYAIALG